MLPFTIPLNLSALTNDVSDTVDMVVALLVVKKHIPVADLMVYTPVLVVGTNFCSITDLGTDEIVGVPIEIVCPK